MTKAQLENKIFDLEKKLDLIKKAVTGPIDFRVDEKNWQKIKSELKKSREKIYKKYYAKEK